MGNSSTKLAEKCSLLSRDEIPVVASSFKLVSKNSERIKEDDLMVMIILLLFLHGTVNDDYDEYKKNAFSINFRNFGDRKWILVWHNT